MTPPRGIANTVTGAARLSFLKKSTNTLASISPALVRFLNLILKLLFSSLPRIKVFVFD
jgi:hypothetical protein